MVLRRILPIYALCTAFGAGAVAADGRRIEFNRDIRPILSENCFYCHGQDPKHREGKLRLDLPEEATRDRGGYAAVNPGHADKSEAIARVESDDPDDLMPPLKSHRSLNAEQKAALKQWIAEGATYQKHWAFIPPAKAPAPVVKRAEWPRHPLDRFVLARLEAEGLAPSPEAKPEAWLRRAHFDLTGLPPEAQELDAFLADVAAHGEPAYEAASDRLLASSHFGERLAIDWLDVARFADTHGFNNDSARTMWPWRDWIIDAFNSNKPYNEFIVEQIAGDLLPHPTLDQKIATGFCRNHVINSEGGIIEEEYRVEYVADRVRTMSLAWLGLTVECARCHDHKFDPLTQRDYYSLFAFFNSVPETGEDGRVANAMPMIPAPSREQRAQLAQDTAQLAEFQSEMARRREVWAWDAAQRQTVEAWLAAAQSTLPASLLLSINCDAGEPQAAAWSFPGPKPVLAEGILGSAWQTRGESPLARLEMKEVKFEKPLAFSVWLRPDADNPNDVALLSNQNYGGVPAGGEYRKGEEIRLVDGEIDLRIAERFPAYALRVVTRGAAIAPETWHQLTVCYDGAPVSAKVRLFVDGRELAVSLLTDGMQASAKPMAGAFLLGWDGAKDSAKYKGRMDELRVYSEALTSEKARTLFFTQAIPHAMHRLDEGTVQGAAPVHEKEWLGDFVLRANDAGYRALAGPYDRLLEKHVAMERELPTTMVMSDLPERRPAYVLTRGQYNMHGVEVSPGVPEALLAPWPDGAPRNRLGLALWLTQANHPLTARVAVNRIWAQLFGTGIVKTVEDFGSQGEWPSHPEALDWLAREFIESGWNVKAMYKSLVLSATYRQNSAISPDLLARDPENRLLARGPRFRLPAELVRDQALAVSGLLADRVGGPSVYPYQPETLYNGTVVGADYPGTKWLEGKGEDLYRRSLYTFWKRTVSHPAMLAFDSPDREICTARRSRTNTPLQALVLLNETGFREAARQLGARMLKEGGGEDASRVRFGFRAATCRYPSEAETRVLIHSMEYFRAEFTRDADSARNLLKGGASAVDATLPVSDLAAASTVASMILNLDETITKN